MNGSSGTGFSDRHLWQVRPIFDAALLVAAFGLVAWIGSLREVLMPVFTGLLFAYIVEPLVAGIHRRAGVPRVVVSSFLLVAGILIAALIALWFLPLIINQGYTLLKNAPEYINAVSQVLAAKFGLPGEQMLTKLQPEPMVLLRILGGAIGFASSAVFWVLLLPFFFFAFSWKFPRLFTGLFCLVPAAHREEVARIVALIDREWGSFFRARLFVGIGAGFLMAFGWFLTDVPYWFLLGMFGGLLGIVPYLSVLAWFAMLIFKFLAPGAGLQELLWPSLVFWGVHLLEEWVLIPWVQCYACNLSPVTVIIAILIGGSVGGIAGLLLALPIASAVKILFNELAMPRLEALVDPSASGKSEKR